MQIDRSTKTVSLDIRDPNFYNDPKVYNVDVYNNLTSKGGGGIWFFNNRIFAPGGETTSTASFEGFTDEVNIFNNLVEGDLLCNRNNFVATSGNVVFGQDTCTPQ